MIRGGGLLPVYWDILTGKGRAGWGVGWGGGGGGGGGVVCSQWSAHCSTVRVCDK